MKTCTIGQVEWAKFQCCHLCRTFHLILVCRGSDRSGNHNIIHTGPNGHESLCITLSGSPDCVYYVISYFLYVLVSVGHLFSLWLAVEIGPITWFGKFCCASPSKPQHLRTYHASCYNLLPMTSTPPHASPMFMMTTIAITTSAKQPFLATDATACGSVHNSVQSVQSS